MFRRLDDRISRWATLNEPWVVSDGGYLHGPLAPGHKNLYEAPIASHNMMRAHGAAVQAYRATGKNQIGIVVNLEPQTPATDSDADRAACNRWDAYMNRQYLDPAFFGSYSAELAEIFGDAWPSWPERDLELIKQPIDFLGVNYYTRSVRRDDPTAWPVRGAVVRQPAATYTETSWRSIQKLSPSCSSGSKQRYGSIPIYITENGAAFYDPPTAAEDGSVRDPLRVCVPALAPARRRTTPSRRASTCGATWSGPSSTTSSGRSASPSASASSTSTSARRAHPKDSARYYSRVIASHGAVLAEPLE